MSQVTGMYTSHPLRGIQYIGPEHGSTMPIYAAIFSNILESKRDCL